MAETLLVKSEPVGEQAHKLCIVLSKGTLDMAYPAFMLANTAAAMGEEVHVFFTFWGFSVVNKDKVDRLPIATTGNPGLGFPAILGVLPGAQALATAMMKRKIRALKMQTIHEMVVTAKETGVHLHACSTTMEMLGLRREDLLSEVEDVIGAATFLQLAEGAQTLFI